MSSEVTNALAKAAGGSRPQNAIGEGIAFTAYDTVFFECAATLSNADLFTSATKQLRYRNVSLPSASTEAYRFSAISVTTNIRFGTVATLLREYWDYFQKFSYIEPTFDGKQYGTISLADAMTNDYVTDNNVLMNRSKFTNYYKLAQPWSVQPNSSSSFRLVAAEGLTTAAYAGATTPILPGSGLGNSSSGFYVKVSLIGEKYRLIR